MILMICSNYEWQPAMDQRLKQLWYCWNIDDDDDW